MNFSSDYGVVIIIQIMNFKKRTQAVPGYIKLPFNYAFSFLVLQHRQICTSDEYLPAFARLLDTANIAKRDVEVTEILEEESDAIEIHKQVMDELSELKPSELRNRGASVEPVKKAFEWRLLANAAVLVVAVGLAFSAGQLQQTGLGSSTAQVYVLDVTRSLEPQLTEIIVDASQPLVTLVAYPSFDGYRQLVSQITEFRGVADEFARSPDSQWSDVAEFVNGVGNQDSLALNLASEELSPGIYRLQVFGERDGGRVLDLQLYFEVVVR